MIFINNKSGDAMKKIMLFANALGCLFLLFAGGKVACEPESAGAAFDSSAVAGIAINADIDREVFELFVKLNESYREEKGEVTVVYETRADEAVLSYLFDFHVYREGKTIRKIKRAYNYRADDGQPLVLSASALKEKYLPRLAREMEKRGYAITENDLKYFKYSIGSSEIIFFYPLDYDANYIEVRLPNLGGGEAASAKPEKPARLAALTFDDGPGPATKQLVDLLDSYGVKATFFLLGERARLYPEAAAYIHASGHELGNHSYSHPDFTDLSPAAAAREIAAARDAIYRATRSYPKHFRFPYGHYYRDLLPGIALPVVLWNCDSEDWRYRDGQAVYQNVIAGLSDRAVILFHDNGRHKTVIEAVINYLLAAGYEFVTVSEMFAFYAEENVVFGRIYS